MGEAKRREDAPEPPVCVLHTHEELKHRTWCGRPKFGFQFVDIDHAAYAQAQGFHAPTCLRCLAEIRHALEDRSWPPTGIRKPLPGPTT